MRVAIVAPRHVPPVIGGAENLWAGLHAALDATPGVSADLIALASPESSFWEIVDSYRAFSRLSLDQYDRIISTKYPAWIVRHRHHTVYLQHKLRGLYDTYPAALPVEVAADAPISAALRRLLARKPRERAALDELFGLLGELRRCAGALPAQLFALPGPLIRAVVHALDAIALAPESIRRYVTISDTVAQRADYFPSDVEVGVVHHPTGLAGLHCDAYETIFTASRLDAPKRIDLLIEAYLRAGVSLPFRIAGEGPELDRLRGLAKGCDSIRFLGRLSDAGLAAEYARALFVPFVPEQEDYGLVTVEAMLAGKAVVTTGDAGGVTELVRDGETGRVVEARADALGQAMRQLVEDREATIAMGKRAAASVAHITWQRLVRELLAEAPRQTRARRRKRIAVVNTFASYPPLSGGQQRMYHLYRRLAAYVDVVQVNLVPAAWQPETRVLDQGFTEVLVPCSEQMSRAQRDLAAELGASADDLAAMTEFGSCTEWLAQIRHYAERSDFVVASHPYVHPAIRWVWRGPVIYEAHNVEADLKLDMFPGKAEMAGRVRKTEGECARQAPLVLACSGKDAGRLAELYAFDPGKLAVVENGVDCDSLPFCDLDERRRLKARLGMKPAFCALFAGSWHLPNVRAAQRILRLAAQRPDVQFFILGSVAMDRALATPPANVRFVGTVSEREKRLWLSAVDVGLNPMEEGSGTNLKLMDYAAAGVPILSTAFGARGGILAAQRDFWEASMEEMPAALSAIRDAPAEEVRARIRNARARVQSQADWRGIAERYVARLESL